MSYILDALRKADAQRSRDPARGIHAQPVAVAVPTEAGRPRRAYWSAAAAAALIVFAAGWFWFSPAEQVAPPVAQAPLPPPQPVVRSELPPQAAAQPAAPATEVLPPPPEPAVAVAPRSVPAAARPAASGTVTAAPAAAVPVPAPAPAAERAYSLAELPADVLQTLPKFNVTGGVYSENVAQRMLVVNGQVFNEGSEIATGVVLEQIRPRVALLKFRGLRIALPY